MATQSSESLDDLDRTILQELAEDGRRAFRQIARNVGTSEATVRARVKRMQDLDVLRIVAFADPERVGDAQLALVLLRVDPRRHQEVVDALVELPQITYVSTLLGRVDICAEVRSANNLELWEFLNTQVGTIEGVLSSETISVLHVHKLRYGAPSAPGAEG